MRKDRNIYKEKRYNIGFLPNASVKPLNLFMGIVAEDILTSKQSLDEFGRLLDYTWKLKRSVSSAISTNEIDDLYAKAINAGALGGKLLGAGGGGFLLFYVEKEKQDKVKLALDNLLHVPFEFENGGTQMVYYSAEDYELPMEG